MCIISHATSRKSQITGPFTGYTRSVTLSTERAACHPSGAQNLEWLRDFWKICVLLHAPKSDIVWWVGGIPLLHSVLLTCGG